MKSIEKQTLFPGNSTTVAELEPLTIQSGGSSSNHYTTLLPLKKKECPSNWDFLTGMTKPHCNKLSIVTTLLLRIGVLQTLQQSKVIHHCHLLTHSSDNNYYHTQHEIPDDISHQLNEVQENLMVYLSQRTPHLMF